MLETRDPVRYNNLVTSSFCLSFLAVLRCFLFELVSFKRQLETNGCIVTSQSIVSGDSGVYASPLPTKQLQQFHWQVKNNFAMSSPRCVTIFSFSFFPLELPEKSFHESFLRGFYKRTCPFVSAVLKKNAVCFKDKTIRMYALIEPPLAIELRAFKIFNVLHVFDKIETFEENLITNVFNY